MAHIMPDCRGVYEESSSRRQVKGPLLSRHGAAEAGIQTSCNRACKEGSARRPAWDLWGDCN